MILDGLSNEEKAIVRAKQLMKFLESNKDIFSQYIICTQSIVVIKVYDLYAFTHMNLKLFIDSADANRDYGVSEYLDSSHIISILDMLSGTNQLSRKPNMDEEYLGSGLYTSVLSEPLITVDKNYIPHVSAGLNKNNKSRFTIVGHWSRFRFLVISLCVIHNYLANK